LPRWEPRSLAITFSYGSFKVRINEGLTRCSLMCEMFSNAHKLIVYYLINSITNERTPFSRVLFEKLTGPQVVKNFLVYYATRTCITAFTRACYLSLPTDRSIQSIPLISTP